MKWFDRWFAKMCRRVWDEPQDEFISSPKARLVSNSRRTPGRTPEGNCINFTVFKADGGFIVQYMSDASYANVTSANHMPKLTIVPHGTDLGQTVAHIITLEALKN